MAKKSKNSSWKSLNIIFFIAVLVILLSTFILWRIDNPRTEVIRSKIIDILLPVFWPITYPVKVSSDILRNFETYSSLTRKNKELRRDNSKNTRASKELKPSGEAFDNEPVNQEAYLLGTP